MNDVTDKLTGILRRRKEAADNGDSESLLWNKSVNALLDRIEECLTVAGFTGSGNDSDLLSVTRTAPLMHREDGAPYDDTMLLMKITDPSGTTIEVTAGCYGLGGKICHRLLGSGLNLPYGRVKLKAESSQGQLHLETKRSGSDWEYIKYVTDQRLPFSEKVFMGMLYDLLA